MWTTNLPGQRRRPTWPFLRFQLGPTLIELVGATSEAAIGLVQEAVILIACEASRKFVLLVLGEEAGGILNHLVVPDGIGGG